VPRFIHLDTRRLSIYTIADITYHCSAPKYMAMTKAWFYSFHLTSDSEPDQYLERVLVMVKIDIYSFLESRLWRIEDHSPSQFSKQLWAEIAGQVEFFLSEAGYGTRPRPRV
jgi:hypothetical protein